MDIKQLVNQAIKEWNDISDFPIGGRTHTIQIRAFIIGKGGEFSNEDIMVFITQDLLD